MVHFWRSFYRAILHDPAYPERILFPKEQGKPVITLDKSDCPGLIAHMGYAQRRDIVFYKWLIHGHLGEYRRDIDWFRERYINPDAKRDLHPVGSEYWNWESVNPADYMPEFMRDHPYAGLEIIP